MAYTSSLMTVLTTEVFDRWFAALSDLRAKARISARIRRAELGNVGDCAPVGRSVFEMWIHQGPGYRIHFIRRGREILVLLGGGDKSTQDRDIKSAQALAARLP